MSRKIEVELNGADVRIEASGFEGKACEKATEFLDEELNGLSRVKKPEYAKVPRQVVAAKVRA